MFENLFRSDTPSPLLKAAYDDVSEMLEHAGNMLDLACRQLLDNEQIDIDLDQLDDEVDQGERLVRRAVLQHLAVQPRQDLVASLVLVSIVQDAERIGDFARGLSELVALARSPREGSFRDRLRAAHQRLRPLFAETAAAFRADDVQGATAVISEAVQLKAEMVGLVADIAASELSADMAVVYSDAARILRRIGSHLSNICSTVSQPYDRIRHGDESA